MAVKVSVELSDEAKEKEEKKFQRNIKILLKRIANHLSLSMVGEFVVKRIPDPRNFEYPDDHIGLIRIYPERDPGFLWLKRKKDTLIAVNIEGFENLLYGPGHTAEIICWTETIEKH